MIEKTMLGVGAYTIPEAARLIGARPAALRRWVQGYAYSVDGETRAQPPLWPLQYETGDDKPILGFRDLIEARIVRGLRAQGIGLPTVRLCLDRAREMVGDDHPFSSARFRTDGRKIFLEMTRDTGEPELIDLKSRQQLFHRIVAPSFADLDFDEEAAVRWWPLKSRRSVVLDPQRAFGQPIVAQTGIATARLAEAYEAEGRSLARVARLYELPQGAIKDALAFEARLAGAPQHKAAA